MNRDIRSLDTVSQEDLTRLSAAKVTVVGAGGLGGYVIEMLVRLGIGTIQLVDGDVFDESNLNRQLYATEENLGKMKVTEAKKRVMAIRSDVKLQTVAERLISDNVGSIFKGSQVVMDCVDNVTSRLMMAKACATLGIPMVHGAVGAWCGQIMTVMPGDGSIEKLFSYEDETPSTIGAASFIPGCIAACQVAECIKLLTGKGTILKEQMKYIDLFNNETNLISLSGAKE